jgi:hypothetical protein
VTAVLVGTEKRSSSGPPFIGPKPEQTLAHGGTLKFGGSSQSVPTEAAANLDEVVLVHPKLEITKGEGCHLVGSRGL